MRSIVSIAVVLAAAATLSACASSPAPKAPPSPHAAAAAAAFPGCSKLAGSALPLAAYDQLVIAEAARLAPGAGLDRRAKAVVAARVAASCPEFSYLAKQER